MYSAYPTAMVYDTLTEKLYHKIAINSENGMIEVITNRTDTDWWNYGTEYVKLALTPISKIKDEDLIAVCNIANPSVGANNETKARMGRELISSYIDRVSNVHGRDWLQIVDYLRSPVRFDDTVKPIYDAGYLDIVSLIDSDYAVDETLHKSTKETPSTTN